MDVQHVLDVLESHCHNVNAMHNVALMDDVKALGRAVEIIKAAQYAHEMLGQLRPDQFSDPRGEAIRTVIAAYSRLATELYPQSQDGAVGSEPAQEVLNEASILSLELGALVYRIRVLQEEARAAGLEGLAEKIGAALNCARSAADRLLQAAQECPAGGFRGMARETA